MPQQLFRHTHPTQDRSPEGCRLLCGLRDRFVRLWHWYSRAFRRTLGGPIAAVPSAFGGLEPPRAQLGQVVLVRSFRSARILPAPLTPLFVSFRFVQTLEKHLLKRYEIPGSRPSQEVESS